MNPPVKITKLKAADLRSALETAGLDSKGKRPVLMKRLQNYLKTIKNGDDSANQPEMDEAIAKQPSNNDDERTGDNEIRGLPSTR